MFFFVHDDYYLPSCLSFSFSFSYLLTAAFGLGHHCRRSIAGLIEICQVNRGARGAGASRARKGVGAAMEAAATAAAAAREVAVAAAAGKGMEVRGDLVENQFV